MYAALMLLLVQDLLDPDTTKDIIYRQTAYILLHFDDRGTVYPMFGELGKGGGSVSIKIKYTDKNINSVVLKCYPQILPFQKAHLVTMNVPITNQNMEYRFEYVFNSNQQSLQNCLHLARSYNEYRTLPLGIRMHHTIT